MAFDAGSIIGTMTLDSSAFNNALTKAKTNVKQVGQELQNLSGKITSVSRDLQRAGQNLAFFGASLTTPLILAFKSAEKYSLPVQREIEKLNNIFIELRVSIAESLLPVMQKFSNILALLLQGWNALSPAVRNNIMQTTLITGVILTLGGAIAIIVGKIGILFAQMLKWGGVLVKFAALHPILIAISLAIAGVIYAMFKFENVAATVLNPIEIAIEMIAIGWKKVSMAIMEAIGWIALFFKNRDLAQNMVDGIKQIRSEVVDLEKDMEKIFTTGKGDYAESFQGLKDWLSQLKNQFGEIGNLNIDVKKWEEATDSFHNGWLEALKDIKNELKDWGRTGKEVAQELSNYMQTTFSDIFQEGLKGNIRSGKQLLIEFGNFVIKILSDILAQWITTQIIMGLAKAGSSIGAASAGTSAASTSTGSVTGMGSIGSIGGFQEGTERIPYTGIYKLHSGEMVTPRYDAQKHESTQLTIYNMITPESIATAMAGKEGQNVVVNIINTNSLRNGVVRREVNKR